MVMKVDLSLYLIYHLMIFVVSAIVFKNSFATTKTSGTFTSVALKFVITIEKNQNF